MQGMREKDSVKRVLGDDEKNRGNVNKSNKKIKLESTGVKIDPDPLTCDVIEADIKSEKCDENVIAEKKEDKDDKEDNKKVCVFAHLFIWHCVSCVCLIILLTCQCVNWAFLLDDICGVCCCN